MSNETRAGYKIEIVEVEHDEGQMRVRARALEWDDSTAEPRWVELRSGDYDLDWQADQGIEHRHSDRGWSHFVIDPRAGADATLRARLRLKQDGKTIAESRPIGIAPSLATSGRAAASSWAHDGPFPPRPLGPYPLPVQLTRTAQHATRDMILWSVIRNSTENIKFNHYARFLDYVLCGDDDAIAAHDANHRGDGGADGSSLKDSYDDLRSKLLHRRHGRGPLTGTEAYRALRDATDWFLKVHVGVLPTSRQFSQIEAELLPRALADVSRPPFSSEEAWKRYTVTVNNVQLLPYMNAVREKLIDSRARTSKNDDAIIDCCGLLEDKLQFPCFVELIWSYWQEEGMLVQTINAIAQRFQNRRVGGDRDPLANLEIDPLRPLGNLLWGYVQDELSRLSVLRRAHEYEHQYGLRLEGRAVARLRPADRRSKFIEGFHNFLQECHTFYERDDQTTVMADAFPVFNAIKEMHYLLAAAAHNQFGDLPSTARAEMLIQQWLLARPQMREFLGGRIMVPYPEPWMDRVDAMKSVQGWTDTSVVHFNDLATFGEQIILGLRYGAWSLVSDPTSAANFCREFRAEIKGYAHAYRAVTGVDLSAPVANYHDASERNLPPSFHMMRRLASRRA